MMPLRTRSPRLAVSLMGLILLTLVLAACGNTSSSGGSKQAVLEGPEDAVLVYKQRCMQCHGGELEGRMGPETNLQKIGSSLSKEQIIDIIHNGGDRMPAQRGIDEADVEKVASWLASLK